MRCGVLVATFEDFRCSAGATSGVNIIVWRWGQSCRRFLGVVDAGLCGKGEIVRWSG